VTDAALPEIAEHRDTPLRAAPQGVGAAVQSVVMAALLRLRPLLAALALLALVGLTAALLLREWPAAPFLLVAATTLGLIALAGAVALMRGRRRRRALADTLIIAAAHDPDAVLLTDGTGRCLAINPAATLATKAITGPVCPADMLLRWSAEPARVTASLLAEALAQGQARRDFLRPDAELRLSVHRTDPGDEREGLLVWRFSNRADGAMRSVDMLGLPLLTLGPQDAPLVANTAFRNQFGETGIVPAPGAPGAEGVFAFDPDLDAALTPLRNGVNPAPVMLPGPGGLQRRLAYATTARDGQRDILFLPGWILTSGDRPLPSQRHDFEDIPVALLHLDGDGRITDTNRPARSLLGLAPGESRYFSEVVEGLGRPVSDWLDDAREGRALNRPEVLRATLPAQETYVQIILRRAAGPYSDNALVAVVSDATELKSLEARFVQSQKMQAIGQLAGGVAHDFNNLLTAISGHCDLLLLNRDHYDPDYNDLVQIHQNTNRAAALVRQLLAFSRKQTLKSETLSVESLLEELAHLLTRLVSERITLTLSHDPRVGTIRADRRQLEQVIMNLVVNARDAMPMGGEIVIETEAVRIGTELEHGRARLPAGDYAVVRVIDEGVGIPADIIDKIFEPFFTTKRTGEGTGLGLSTAYGIVKQMGGWIFAVSTEGTGTEFSLYFAAHHDGAEELPEAPPRRVAGMAPTPVSGTSSPPAAEHVLHGARPDAETPSDAQTRSDAGSPGASAQEAPRARPITSQTPAPLASATFAPNAGITGTDNGVVLLVEDEGPVRAFAARALRLQGYQVIEAENGEQALEFLEDGGLSVDIFVSDVIMPGIDGPGWVMQALERRPDTPVVFVSGYTEDGLSAALSRIPRSVFLGKPFALQDLTATIASQLGRKL